MQLKALDLFCGGGGSSLGAEAAGAEIICGVDAWDIASKTYQSNFPRAAARHMMLTEDTAPVDLGVSVHGVNLLLASPECTNHSCAKGARPRDEDSRRTARYILNFARDITPRWVALENVIQMRKWEGFAPLISELESYGYHIRQQVIDAATMGVPQTRRRLFLLCDLEKMPDEVPAKTGPLATVLDILDPPGTWQSRPLYSAGRAANTLGRAERAIAELGRGVDFLIVYYGSDASGGWQPLDRPLRTMTTLDRFGLVTWHSDTPMLRMLQVPELKRAMGFTGVLPHGSRRDRVKLLGNGVCAPVMEAVVRTLTRG